jgi:hypothetical protein
MCRKTALVRTVATAIVRVVVGQRRHALLRGTRIRVIGTGIDVLEGWAQSWHLHKTEADVIRAGAGFTFAARPDHVA